MIKERVLVKRWIIWWIYGNGYLVEECKCAQDKMIFWKGDIIRCKIWEIQSIKFQQLSSKILENELNESTVMYSISSAYYQLNSKPTNLSSKSKKQTTVPCIFIPCNRNSKISRIIERQNIKKKVFRILQYPEYSKKKVMKNSKFKATQCLIKRITSKQILISTDIWIVWTNENTAIGNNKFTNISKKYWKCFSYLRIRLR